MTRYRLSPEAQSDLTDIKQYLTGEGGAGVARYVLGEIRSGLQFLAANPDFRARYEAVRPGLTEYLAEAMRRFADTELS